MSPITESQLKFAHQARGLRRLTLHADGSAFELRAHTGGGAELTLVKMRKADGACIPRRFNSPLAALTLLFKLGIHDIHVNLEHWQPNEKSTARTRADSAARMKEAHEALSEKRRRKLDVAASAQAAVHEVGAAMTGSIEPWNAVSVDSSASAQKPLWAARESGIKQRGHSIKVEARGKRVIRPSDTGSGSPSDHTSEQDGQALGDSAPKS